MDVIASSVPAPLMKVTAQLLFWPTLMWNHLLVYTSKGELSWYNAVYPLDNEHSRGKVILGGYPWSESILTDLRDGKVDVILNTVAERSLDQKRVKNIQVIELPMTDFIKPDLESVLAGVELIESHVSNNKVVYVNCKAGKGRSSTIVMCWLILKKGLTAQQAQSWLQSCRPQILRNLQDRDVVRKCASKSK